MHLKLLLSFLLICNSLYSCQIIYLNGTSSVGKTTLAKALQNQLEEPYLLIGIDQMINLMPDKTNDWRRETPVIGFSWKKAVDEKGNALQLLQTGPFGKKIADSLRIVVLALAKQDFNLIVDDVSLGPESAQAWKDTFKDFNVLWVGLTAPIEIIEKRERERGDRQIGQARAAASVVHQGFTYDLFLDTSEIPTAQLVQKITSACSSTKNH